jgi:hypothetical protein
MNAPVRIVAATSIGDDIAILRARCIARAREYAQGDIDLQSAVDSCQQLAEALGLAFLDQDFVQAIMAEIFGAADELAIDPQTDVAASTIAAAEYLIQQGDPARLKSWLATHSASERTAILEHLKRKDAHHAKAVA